MPYFWRDFLQIVVDLLKYFIDSKLGCFVNRDPNDAILISFIFI